MTEWPPLTRQCGRPQRLAHHAKDQRQLVHDELRPPQMVFVVPHVTALKLRPLHLRQVEAPHHRRHLASCSRSRSPAVSGEG